MRKRNLQGEEPFPAEKQKFSRYHSTVFLIIFVILLTHFGIGTTTGEHNFYSSNEKENQLYHPDYEYISQSKSQGYVKEDSEAEETVATSVIEDKSRFWWTSGNRNNSKGPPKPKDEFTGTEAPKDVFNPINTLNFISRLLRYVIINRDSTSRMQFFNANYKRNSSAVNETVPRAIFGGPLCLGLCGVAQVYWANSSVQFFSGNKFPLPPIGAPTNPPLPLPGQG